MSFLKKLESSKTLKVKFKGKMYPVPPPIFNQARKFALESVGIDYDVFRNNPVSEKAKEKQIKKAFEQFLESYLEAIVPQTKSNPSAKKIQAAFKVMDQLADPDRAGGIMEKFFPGEANKLKRTQMSSALKGAIMVITHIYTEGAAGIPKKDMGFRDMPLKEQEQVLQNRLMRATVGFLTMAMISKLYTMDAKELMTVLGSDIPKSDLQEFWRDPKKSDMFFRKLKEKSQAILGRVDLLDAVKL